MQRIATILTTLALLAATGSASAHALLRKASPPVGATLKSAPAELKLTFSEAVEAGFSHVEVRDKAGAEVTAGAPHPADADQRTLLIGLKPLSPGSYLVEWHVTSVDTHKTDGSFSFTVVP